MSVLHTIGRWSTAPSCKLFEEDEGSNTFSLKTFLLHDSFSDVVFVQRSLELAADDVDGGDG